MKSSLAPLPHSLADTCFKPVVSGARFLVSHMACLTVSCAEPVAFARHVTPMTRRKRLSRKRPKVDQAVTLGRHLLMIWIGAKPHFPPPQLS